MVDRKSQSGEGKRVEYFVYILRCADDSLYTGITTDLARRIKAHNEGKGAKYTRSHRPVTLAYQARLPDKSAALREEARIKKLTRAEKEKFIKECNFTPQKDELPSQN